MEQTKKCPYCGEEILAIAKKCKHCGEWLENETPKEKKTCPICGEMVNEDLDTCPYCHEQTHFGDTGKPMEAVSEGYDVATSINDTPPVNIKLIKKVFPWIVKIAYYILFVLLSGFGWYSIKQCSREKQSKNSFAQYNRFGNSFSKNKDEVYEKLIAAPWFGNNSFSEIEEDSNFAL